MSKTLRTILSIAAPIAGTLLLPGVGTALGIGGLTASGGATALGGALGGGIGGAAGGAIRGGGLSDILKGGALGAGGGYLSSGGASDLFGGTALGRAAGLATPEGGSVAGNVLGSSAEATPASGNFLSNILGGGGASYSPTSQNVSVSSPAIAGTGTGSGLTGDFARGVANNSPAFSNLTTPALSTGIGTGTSAYGGGGVLTNGSSYGGIGTLSALLGGANSLDANTKAQKALLQSQGNAMTVLQPYLASGSAANSKLSNLLGAGGDTSAAGYGTLGQPFTPGDLTKEPGYQFQKEQGDLALQRSEAARGTLNSGASMKAAEDYGQGLAGTTYNNAYQRYLQQQQQQYGMLAGQSGQGANAAGAAGNIYTNVGNARAGAGISSSNILNSTLSSLLSGSGAKRPVNIGGQVVYM